MVLFNNLYYKKNYLFKGRAAIILGIIEVPELFKLFKNRDLLKQPIEEALKIINILDKLIEPSKPL